MGQISVLQHRNELLKKRVADQKAVLDKLVETRRTMANELTKLRKELQSYKKRDYREEFDTAQHNTKEAMDAFFEVIDNVDPYLKFAQALKSVLDEHGIDTTSRTVLDWGTGPGIVLHHIVRDSPPRRIVGHDTSEVALAKARELMPDGHFLVADIYQPVSDQYDVVLCTEVLEHLENPAAALQNLLAARAPSGVLIVTVPDGRIDYSRYHINFWSPESWKLFVQAHLPASVRATFGTFRLSESTVHRNNYAVIRPK